MARTGQGQKAHQLKIAKKASEQIFLDQALIRQVLIANTIHIRLLSLTYPGQRVAIPPPHRAG